MAQASLVSVPKPGPVVESATDPAMLGLLNLNNADRHLRDVIPRAKVEYLTGEAPPDFRKGHFTFSLGYQKETVRCVLLAMRFTRIMWPPYNGMPSIEPLCRSNDGIRSTGGTIYPPEKPMACEQCVHSQWKDKQAPACSETYPLLLWDLDDDLPFVLGVKRTSIMSLRKAKTALKLSAKKWAYPGTAPNACVSMVLKTRPVQNFYVIELPQRDLKGNLLWERLPEDKARELSKVALDLTGTFSDIDVQQVVDTNVEAESQDPSEVPF